MLNVAHDPLLPLKYETFAKVHEITDEGISMIRNDKRIVGLECDSVVLAAGMTPNKGLWDTLVGNFVGEIYEIGDCKEPRKIHDAIWEGWNVARGL
jgi:2-enoate reductase